jgi:hypothetical protein
MTNMIVSESKDTHQVAVSVSSTVAGTNYSNIRFYVYQPLDTHIEQPFLQGEDYPTLVRTWNNKDDDIFDNL